MTTYSLEIAGATPKGRSFDVRTRTGAYAGIVAEHYGRFVKVYFNSSATKGSARKFTSIQEALEFIHARRVKKGLAA